MFKRSLDDQRRMKQESCSQQHPSNTGNQGYHVPGLTAALPDDLNAPHLSHIPGLDQHQPGGGHGYAPRFEASRSPQQEKQPYMSAVSIAFLFADKSHLHVEPRLSTSTAVRKTKYKKLSLVLIEYLVHRVQQQSSNTQQSFRCINDTLDCCTGLSY